MVLYKRKPVKAEPEPPFLDDSTEVWYIDKTGEVFVDYDQYLNRLDFYNQKNFTCESTGHQGYTYFEALESELEASKEINLIFPDYLRARVLQFVQFRNTARIDDLVNEVYDYFRDHYEVGDHVSIEQDNKRLHGVVSQMQDNSKLHTIITGQPVDEDLRTYTYTIALESGSDQRVTRYKAAEIQRDRRNYSKLLLKQFLRSTTVREAWYGAPWTVKAHLAKKYGISSAVPQHQTKEAVTAVRRATNFTASHAHSPSANPLHAHMPNGSNAAIANGTSYAGPRQPPQPLLGQTTFVNFSANPQPAFEYLQNRPLPTGYEPTPVYHQAMANPAVQRPPIPDGRPTPYPPQNQSLAPPQILQHYPSNLPLMAHHMPPSAVGQLPIGQPLLSNFTQYRTLPPTRQPPQAAPVLPKPFEPVKYPIEDLRIKQPRAFVARPPLKFISDDVPEGAKPPDKKHGIHMTSVGPLLCAWETLNVHDGIYYLDSFTFDDFIGALRFSSEDVECELLAEVHCAVLKQIVNESGKLQAPLPTMEDSDDSEEEDSNKSVTPEPEPEPPVRATRSSLRKSEANSIVKQRIPTPESPKQIHKAAEFLAEFDWIEQCKIRNFREGGWQAALVGLLYALSFSPVHKKSCEAVLAELVPPDNEPSIESIASHYVTLDINLRITALDMALQLTVVTDKFREELTNASFEMTRLRKQKIEYQRKRKELADDVFKLDNERKILLPHISPPSPTEPSELKEDQITSQSGTEEAKSGLSALSHADSSNAASEEPQASTRGLRKKRKSETDTVKKEKKKPKIETPKTKQRREWDKLLKAISDKQEELKKCEAKINDLDDDLRETLVHRSKMIGKDRFLNKYYWFEHNGMPFGGLPDSSTADYGYANGRLWVQGPDEYELQPNLEEPALSQDRMELGFDIPTRKENEEGSTHLSNSTEWGYYDDPSELASLISWLDERGLREKALRKELLIFRDRISEYMTKMKEHLSKAEKAKTEDEETHVARSTRTKSNIDKDVYKDPCLNWTNSIMREKNNHIHSDEYEPPKKVKKGTARVSKGRIRRF